MSRGGRIRRLKRMQVAYCWRRMRTRMKESGNAIVDFTKAWYGRVGKRVWWCEQETSYPVESVRAAEKRVSGVCYAVL
jgi:hypothetical protein